MNIRLLINENFDRLILIIVIIPLLFSQIVQGETSPQLYSSPVVSPKTTELISQEALDFLRKRDGDTLSVWVFFTDKQVLTQSQFQEAAKGIVLTERAKKRRAKVGADQVLFIDLPVSETYVEQVIALGGVHRRSSRWLNASSFEIPSELLSEIGELSFVSKIRPLASLNVSLPIGEIQSLQQLSLSQTPDVLNYGGSITQLSQINVPAMHALGYTGSGVTLTMIDTGFRKTHEAFASHYIENRVLAEYDFILDNPIIGSFGWSHGTSTWSVAGGAADGTLYGPAYKANFILCRTVDFTNETPAQEDYWLAAMEFADSIGTDVISSSLGYGDWYTYSDYDGETTVITQAANLCDGLGIVLCNAIGNRGPSVGSLFAPADAKNILSVGAVTSSGAVVSFSGRGPTFDSGSGSRIKPEVCAMGASVVSAKAGSDADYSTTSGTSLATPLIAGSACLLIEAHPNWSPAQVREALMSTASNSSSPDNNIGWGIIDVLSANDWQAGPCCVGLVGNVDGDPEEIVDIGDVTYMISYFFIAPDLTFCSEEANLDGDTAGVIDIDDLNIIIDYLFLNNTPLMSCP